MLAFIPILLTSILGITITFVITKDMRVLERIGLGYLIGIGIQTWIMFCLSLLGAGLTTVSFLIQWLAFIVILGIILFLEKRLILLKSFFQQVTNLKKIWSNSDKIFVTIFSSILLISLIIGLYWPVIGWDALALYDFRAQSFLATGSMADAISREFFFGYPLLTSLGHTWVYMFGGNPHLIHWMFYASFLITTYSLLRSRISEFSAKLTVITLAIATPLFQQSFFDYTYLSYLVYLTLSYLYIDKWIRSTQNWLLIVAFILIGLSTWTRATEPFWITLIFISVIGLILKIKKFKSSPGFVLKTLLIWILSLSLFFAIQQSWKVYSTSMLNVSNSSLVQVNYLISDAKRFNLLDFGEIVVATYAVTMSTWQPALVILLILLILERKKANEYKYILLILLISILILIAGSYDYSLYISDWRDILPSQRGLSGFIPILLIILIFSLSDETLVNFSKKIGLKNDK